MSESTEPDDLGLAEMPTFDEASLKRAIRRGVLRTALEALVILFAVTTVWELAGTLIGDKLIDRGGEARAEGALIAAHPGAEMSGLGGGPSGLLGRPFRFTMRARDSGETVEGKGKTSIFGRPSVDLVSQVISVGAADVLAQDLENLVSIDTAPVLERTPPVLVSAVIAFRQPTPAADVRAALGGPRSNAVIVYERTTKGPFVAPVSWPAYGFGSRNPSLAAWVASLKPEDDGLLRSLRLPPRGELQAIAKADRATGLVVTRMRSRDLLALLRLPMVRAATLTTADLDLSP